MFCGVEEKNHTPQHSPCVSLRIGVLFRRKKEKKLVWKKAQHKHMSVQRWKRSKPCSPAWRGMKSLCLPHCPPCWELVRHTSQLLSAEGLLDPSTSGTGGPKGWMRGVTLFLLIHHTMPSPQWTPRNGMSISLPFSLSQEAHLHRAVGP